MKVWPAPAKLNLFLHVNACREDGYHELQTLFQLLDWGDTVYVSSRNDGLIERVRDLPEIAEDDDLCIRAARLLQTRAGKHCGASIAVDKHIPAGAGLGGGSSNAATVLCVLNRLWACGLDADELAALGLQLGADVPVFVRGRSAWAEGVGEKLFPYRLGTGYYLLVFPPFALSTADVFQAPDLVRNTPRIKHKNYDEALTRNDCEPVALRLRPELGLIMDELSVWGRPRMSGTGSTLFVKMDRIEDVNQAATELKCRYNVRAVGGVDVSPLKNKALNITAENG
jgi:4-diphosphocytidyl-2-C-methyl-D-erythritol kinase